MQRILTFIWRLFLVLTFLSGLGLLILWLLRAYSYPILADRIPDAAFEPLISTFLYLTGFSGVGAILTWFAQTGMTIAQQRQITTDGGDYAERDVDKRQGTFYAGGTHYHYDDPRSRTGDAAALDPRLRAHLLSTLDTRYKRRLEDNLEEQVRIALDLRTLPTAVVPQWRLHLHGPTRSRDIPAGTSIAQIVDDAGGELLILGAPGAGKTTMLLDLAREVIARAQADVVCSP